MLYMKYTWIYLAVFILKISIATRKFIGKNIFCIGWFCMWLSMKFVPEVKHIYQQEQDFNDHPKYEKWLENYCWRKLDKIEAQLKQKENDNNNTH